MKPPWYDRRMPGGVGERRRELPSTRLEIIIENTLKVRSTVILNRTYDSSSCFTEISLQKNRNSFHGFWAVNDN